MKGKKVLAAMLAATMVLGSSVTAFAGQTTFPSDDSGAITGDMDKWNTGVTGGESGSGSMAGSVDRNIFHVMLPTKNVDLLKSALAFQLDPQMLITSTSGAGLANKSGFASGKTLYFPNVGATTSASIYYTDESSKFTVKNMGSVDVDVSVDAELTDLKKDGTIVVTDDATFDSGKDTTTSMYMTILTDNNNTTGYPLKADENGETAKASIETATIGAVTSSAFTVKLENGEYKYELADPLNTAFEEFSFWLKGSSNTNGDWDALAQAKKNPEPQLTLTWRVKPHSDSYATSNTIKATDTGRVVNYVAPNGVDPVEMVLTRVDGTTIELIAKDLCAINKTDKRFSVKLTGLQNNIGGTIAVKYSDGHVDTLTIIR